VSPHPLPSVEIAFNLTLAHSRSLAGGLRSCRPPSISPVWHRPSLAPHLFPVTTSGSGCSCHPRVCIQPIP